MNTLVALCALGAERIIGNEVKHLGYHLVASQKTNKQHGRITFTGDDDAPMLSCLSLRTADRVLLQMAECRTETFDDLFDCVYLVDWQDFFNKDCRVVVDKVRTQNSMLESGRSVQAIVQKAIYTKLGDKWHIKTMPESGNTHTVRVYIVDDVAAILLDLSGEPLHKRGYRLGGGIAPLRETMAAVMLQEMLWRRKTPLLDPFCGSGTIAAEAALYAYNVAPGLGRHFALETLSCHNAKRMAELRAKLSSIIRTDVQVRISASDIDSETAQRARANIERALSMAGRALQSVGRDERIPRPIVDCADALTLQKPSISGLILTNPPYGERLGDKTEAIELYKKMSVMKEHFDGWQFGILTPCKEFLQYFDSQSKSSVGTPVARILKAGNMDTMLYRIGNKE